MSMLIQTAALPLRERRDFWCTAISESFVPMDISLADAGPFSGCIRGRSLGALQVAEVTADAHIARRTARQAARADTEYLKLSVPIRGYCLVMQDGREAPLTPGDMAIYDTNRPYTLAFEDTCQLLVLMFSRRFLRVPPDAVNTLTAQRVSGRQGIGALASPLLRDLVTRIDEIDPVHSQRVADSVLDLLSTLFVERLGNAREPAKGSVAGLLVRVKAFIEDHLHDVDLTPDAVAASSHISTGYLHKLFRTEGTSVSHYIRDRRLEQCRRDLVDPSQYGVPVSSVGAHWGFVDAARFSRVFKAAYGASPREYRLSRDPFGEISLCGGH